MLVDDMERPRSIAVDDDSMFAALGGVVIRMLKSGGSIMPLTTGGVRMWDVALDGERVYWTDLDLGEVGSVEKSGANSELIAAEQGGPAGIAVDTDGVYWVNRLGEVMMRAK